MVSRDRRPIRAFWNLRVNGKWYRASRHGRLRLGFVPGDPETLDTIKSIQQDSLTSVDDWVPVPFPAPLHRTVHYVYTLDLDSAHLTLSQWRYDPQGLMLTAIQVPLGAIEKASDLFYESLSRIGHEPPSHRLTAAFRIQPAGSAVHPRLAINLSPPTQLNELQHVVFTDFIYQWRFYLDDPSVWQYPFENMFCIAILRLAAWDLEVAFDGRSDLPLKYRTIPRWKYPETDIYWFHGFLVVQFEALQGGSFVDAAVSKAQAFLGKTRPALTHVILVSLCYIALAEISHDKASCSAPIPLITNSSGLQCSPGFRVLSSILTSLCWKGRCYAGRENWDLILPPEVLRMVLTVAEPRDVVSLSQASFLAEQWYYTLIPQFGDFQIESFEASISCCWKRKTAGISCSVCYKWQHNECVQHDDDSAAPFLCLDCNAGRTFLTLTPGGINSTAYRRRPRTGPRLTVDGKPRLMGHRDGLPRHSHQPAPSQTMSPYRLNRSTTRFDFRPVFPEELAEVIGDELRDRVRQHAFQLMTVGWNVDAHTHFTDAERAATAARNLRFDVAAAFCNELPFLLVQGVNNGCKVDLHGELAKTDCRNG